MYAIIATGGKQYKVSEGDVINVEKLAVEAGETVTFDNIVAVSDGSLKAGADVANATVTASVVKDRMIKTTHTAVRIVSTSLLFPESFIFFFIAFPLLYQIADIILQRKCQLFQFFVIHNLHKTIHRVIDRIWNIINRKCYLFLYIAGNIRCQ